jgi:tetratricopeptide (TPR) repeat protein
MAEHTALVAAAKRPILRTRSEARKQLWQVPTFVAGLLALFAVWAARPLWHVDEQGRIDRQLATLRRALDQSPTELRAVVTQTEAALPAIAPFPRRSGEAHFLIGVAYLHLGDDPADPSAAADWQAARSHLEQAEGLSVSDSDHARLTYLLGKVWHHYGVDPERVISCLSSSVEDGAEDRVEGYGLLVEAYLRLPTPDLHAALLANEKQLATPSLNDLVLARARLQRAELLFKLEEPDEARKVLTHVLEQSSAVTPPDVRSRARALLARGYQDDGSWAMALPLWEEARADARTPAADQGRILFALGVCYSKLGREGDATQAWEQASQHGGEPQQAAALALAELRLHGAQPARALDAFRAALANVTTSAEYHNSLIDLPTVRTLLENASRGYRDAGAFESAQEAAKLYEKVALPGKGQELFALAADAWARSVLANAVPDAAGRIGDREQTLARDQYRQAAAAYETAAGLTARPAERAAWLWCSADRYLQAQDPEQAVLVLQRYVQLESLSPERLGETWFRIGEAHRAARHDVAARNAYLNCIAYVSPFAYRARYQLAVDEITRGQFDNAEAHLKQNLELIQQAMADNEALEQSLYTLGNLLFQRGEYRLAELRLHEALERFPANPNAVTACFQLARCCRLLADQESQRVGLGERATSEVQVHYRMQRHKWLEMSGSYYQKITDDLSARSAAGRLTAEEDSLLRQASFALADCRFAQGQFEEARRLYGGLAERYHHQIDGLLALWNVWRCCLTPPARPDLARAAYQRIQTALQEMNPAVFDGSDALRTKQWWNDWLLKNQ